MGLTGGPAGPGLPEDNIHDEAVPQQPARAHGQVQRHDGHLEPQGQEGPTAGVEQQVGGQQAVVGAQEGQVALQVAAVEDLPKRGGEEGLHVDRCTHSAPGAKLRETHCGYAPEAHVQRAVRAQHVGPAGSHGPVAHTHT